MSNATHRPAVPGAVLAVLSGAAAVALLLDAAAQWRALLAALAGIAVCGLGYAAWQRSEAGLGALVALAGAALLAVGFFLAATGPETTTHRLELLPGLLGLAVLAAGLLPVRAGRERTLVTVGTALLFVGVVASGVFRGSPLLALLAATVATVVAWDAGEQAVSLGRQVGRQAATARAVLMHSGGTILAGAVVALAALGVYRLNVTGLSLTALVALLAAGFVLILSLRN
ncbi:DUF7519 family protein [Halomicrobium salinisoli]|uniref:DUF7519 family protein n=1 Tax=Halomicrobium salinisoli TaxID=2878391 RepID=UPI001CF05020|nr:hypothetical protein [Halomicrobium salinisoli]